MKRGKELGFDCSQRLKDLFNEQYEIWRKVNSADLADLAVKCGVSSAYLAHVRRYGRIPSRPVMILLALNFKIPGKRLFDAAGIGDEFPYASNLEITTPTKEDLGLFSVKFNSDAFVDAIRTVIRSEVKTRTPRDLLRDRPLKIGLNYHQYWLFGSHTPPESQQHTGLFPEICKMLGLALQIDIELIYVPYASYMDKLLKGEIDLYGPSMVVPNLPARILFSRALYELGISGLWRKREAPGLQTMPEPKKADDLQNVGYKIAVTRNTYSHLIANTRFGRSDQDLILCSSDEEALERITLRGLQRPAHIFISNSITSIMSAKEHPQSLGLLFAKRNSVIDYAANAIAIRPDWPEMVQMVNEALSFLLNRGGVSDRLRAFHSGQVGEVVNLIS